MMRKSSNVFRLSLIFFSTTTLSTVTSTSTIPTRMYSTLALVSLLHLSSGTTTPPLQLALVSPFASQDKTARAFLNSEKKKKEKKKKVEDYAPPPPYKAPDPSIYSSPPAPKPSYSPASPSYLEPPPPPAPKSPNTSYASPLSLPYAAEKPNPPSHRAPASFPAKDSKSRAPVVQHPHQQAVDLYASPGAPDLYGAPPPDPTTTKAPPEYVTEIAVPEPDLNIFQLVPLFLITTIAVIASTIIGSLF